jgi:cell division protein FtsZ
VKTVKVTVIATGLLSAKKEASAAFATRTPAPVQTFTAPIMEAAPKYEAPRTVETPVQTKNTDYAVKSDITFDLEGAKEEIIAPKAKINWAEKLQTAASKYESQKNFEANTTSTSVATKAPAVAERQEYSHFDNAETNQGNSTAQAAHNRESRIKSIAEKLGFFNFDEDEFDTPSFMKKNDRNHDSQI